MDKYITKIKTLSTFPYNILSIVVVAAFLIRIYNLNFNSPFLDEAIYVILGQRVFEGHISEISGAISWVGAFPFFYPVLSAVFYAIGGIIGARFFVVILGVISVVLIYIFTKELKLLATEKENQIAGIAAAAFMATSAIPIEASRLAIYDGLSFALFVLALVLYTKALNSRNQLTYLYAAIAFFLSFLAKYITVIFFPFLLILPLVTVNKKKLDIIKSFWVPFLLLPIFYFILNATSLIEYFSTQIGDPSTTYLDVLKTFWDYTWILYALAFGALFLWGVSRNKILALLFMSTVPIILHVFTKNNFSAHQHTFLTIVFLLPLIGAFFSFLIENYKKVGVAALIVVAFLNLLYSIPQVADMESFWPNTKEASALIKAKVNANDTVLVESGDSMALDLKSKVPYEQIVGPFSFVYQGEEGDNPYIKAVADGYFRFVELENVYFSSELVNSINGVIDAKYTKIFDDGKVRVFEVKK